MKSPIDKLAGLGLRSEHYPHLEIRAPQEASWFEAISENYMNSAGRPREFLHFIRKDFPVALHGVGMSLASYSGLNKDYIKTLKTLASEIEPFIISDHLCWTGTKDKNLHDLLPFPFTKESLKLVINNVNEAQELLGRQIFVENVSTYMTFKSHEMTEWEFLNELVKGSGCKLLFDINNLYVNAFNHDFSPEEFISHIPHENIGQIHLAGYSDFGTYLFDTHSKPVWPEVWELFSKVIQKVPKIPFMIEWDEKIPSFPDLEKELLKAKKIYLNHHKSDKTL